MARLTIDVEDETIETAKLICIKQGGSLQEYLKELLEKKAKEKVKDAEAVVHESLLIQEVWSPSRATLHSMRTSGELEGFYFQKGTNIFYYLKKTRDYFKKNYKHIEKANKARLE